MGLAHEINEVNELVPVSARQTRTHNSTFVLSRETFIMRAAPG